jgi:hypothetical protein
MFAGMAGMMPSLTFLIAGAGALYATARIDMAARTFIIPVSLVLAVVAGCAPSRAGRDAASAEAAGPSHDGPLLPAVADIDSTPSPDDMFSVHPKIGRRNDSLDRRRMDAADRVLERVKPRLRSASPEQLIAGLRSGEPSNQVEYFVWRDGNKLIEGELLRRGRSAKDALERHAKDPREVWTGAGGPWETVGTVCTRLLAAFGSRVGGLPVAGLRRMNEATFWKIIEAAARDADGECDVLVEHVRSALRTLTPNEIREFDAILDQKLASSYTWPLWGAGYLINGGCSDDGFEYFRCWLISRGRRVFDAAVAQPDWLANVVNPENDNHECEPLLYVALETYEEVTGQQMPRGTKNLPTKPSGESWDFEDHRATRARLPKLSRLYDG